MMDNMMKFLSSMVANSILYQQLFLIYQAHILTGIDELSIAFENRLVIGAVVDNSLKADVDNLVGFHQK